jgi:hypothetical protein
MLKGILFTGFIFLLFNTSFSQTISSQRKEDLNIKKFHKRTVSIDSPGDSVSIPIHSISIVDDRPDSMAIGLFQINKLDPQFIVTQRSFQVESEQYVSKYVHCPKSDSFSVVMVLKKFWISTDVRRSDNLKTWDLEDDTSKRINFSLFTKIEFYLYKDSGYYTLYRFDSVFSAEVKVSTNIVGSQVANKYKSFVSFLVQDALETSLSKLATMDWQWNAILSSKRKFTWHEIEAHENKFFDIPVLKDSLPVPGVYLTFEEFKANNPSVTAFEITKDKLNDIIYIRQPDGRQISLTDDWGYCDSTHQIFVRSNHNYFKLQRRQNAFYIYGSNQVIHEMYNTYYGLPSNGSTSILSAGSTRSEDYKLLLKPFQLDWDSGKLY